MDTSYNIRMADDVSTPQNADSLTPTIFHEPWWLTVASGDRYQEVVSRLDGVPVGRLPFVPSRSLGMSSIEMPPLTHFLGPALNLGSGGPTTRQLRAFSITRELIRALPPSASVWLKLHGGITDTVAFQEMGFTTNVQFTNEITPASPEMLWCAMRDKTRNVIRRAGEQLDVIEERDPERFAAFYSANLGQRSLRSFYDFRIMGAITEECLRRNAGRIIAAVDKTGACKAAIFSVWDQQSEYYLMSTRTVDAGNGASSLLIWEAIQHATKRGLKFDFDGARHAEDMRFFAGFGGSVRPRYWVWRSKFSYQVLSRIIPHLLRSFR
jgi:hypothetical protein